MRARPRLTTVLATLFAAMIMGPGAAVAESDACPEVLFEVQALAAPILNTLTQGAQIDLPIAYSLVEQETVPRRAYAEAGSISLGLLEGTELQPSGILALLTGTLPIPLPDLPAIEFPFDAALPDPPGRTTSAYPDSSLGGDNQTAWGIGVSRTAADAERSMAMSDTGPGVGAFSRVESSFACDTITVNAEWSVRVLDLGDLGDVTQRIRIEMGPTGEPSVNIQTSLGPDVLGVSDLISMLPLGLVDDLIGDAGQRLEVQDPTVDVSADAVHIVANPLRVTVGQPDGSQTVTAHVGFAEVAVKRLGVIPPAPPGGPTGSGDDHEGDVVDSPGALASEVGSQRSSRSDTADAEAGHGDASQSIAHIDSTPIDFRTTRGSSWWWPVLAAILVVSGWWYVAQLNRARWPTADWTLTTVETLARRFATGYLRW